MDNESMVKTIRELCMKNNISISQLENDLEFGAGLVSRWTKSSPSIDKIVDIADYFRVSLDEVVGYHNVVNDKFLEKLISQTATRSIKWNSYSRDNVIQPKQYFDTSCEPQGFYSQEEADEFYNTHKEISYFAEINNVYISLYGMYEYQNIINPLEIKLFIQPGKEAQLIEQYYLYEQLKVLWLKVLYILGDNAPDEIKAEEFKNSFINGLLFDESEKSRTVLNITDSQLDIIASNGKCVLYDLHNNSVLNVDDLGEENDNGEKYYFSNKTALGNVKFVRIRNFNQELFLISDTKIMKLSKLPTSDWRESVEFDGIIHILQDVGFDTLYIDLAKHNNNFTIFPI